MNKTKKNWRTSKGERIAYAMYFAGQLIFHTIVNSFLLVYLLNAGINEVLAGSILLLPKIWDAVNDTLFGLLVDKVRFKSGRFTPWVRIAAIGMPLATIFLFSLPAGTSSTTQVIWVIIGYVLWDTFYTICDTPIYALSTCMTNNLDERTSLLSVTRITGGIGGMVASVLIPLLYGANGANWGWSGTAVAVGVLGALCMLPAAFLIKERYHGQRQNETSFKEILQGVAKNRNLLIIVAVRFFFFLTFTLEVLNAVFCQFVLGDETFASVMTMCISMPIIVLAAFMPMLCRRFDKVHLHAFFIVLFAAGSVAQFFVGYESRTLLLLMTAIRGLGYGGFSTLAFMFVPDCVEYGQYATGRRNEGVSFALQTFITKLNSTLITTIGAFLIAAMGFDSTHVTAQGKQAVWFSITLFSAIGAVVAVVVLLKAYKLRDKDVVTLTAYNNGEITREACEAELAASHSRLIARKR